jgi:hypothetical protein
MKESTFFFVFTSSSILLPQPLKKETFSIDVAEKEGFIVVFPDSTVIDMGGQFTFTRNL